MNVYLLRHGDAAVRDTENFPDDNARALTEEGVENVLLVGHEPHLGEIASELISAKESVVESRRVRCAPFT